MIWIKTLNLFEEISGLLKQNILMDYIINIRSKVNASKRKDKQMFVERHDHQYLLSLELKRDCNQLDIVNNLFDDEELETEKVIEEQK